MGMKVTATFSLEEYPHLNKKEKVDLLQEVMEQMNHTYSLGISVLSTESEEKCYIISDN